MTILTATTAAGGSLATMLLIWGAFLIAMYFFMIRPQNKRKKEIEQQQANLKVGDEVKTTNGMYGKVADIGDNVVIVEFGTNKSVRIPVAKSEILYTKGYTLTKE